MSAWLALAGEKHAPELPIPLSAVEAYAARRRFGFGFVALVRAYDAFEMDERLKARERAHGAGKSKAPDLIQGPAHADLRGRRAPD